MRFVLDLHVELGRPRPPEPEQRDSTLDALVERTTPEQPPPTFGFQPRGKAKP